MPSPAAYNPGVEAPAKAQSSIATRFDVSPRDEIVWVQFRRGKEELWLVQLPN